MTYKETERFESGLINALLRESASRLNLSDEIAEHGFDRHYGAVSPNNANTVAERFSARLYVAREALALVNERITEGESEDSLRAIQEYLTSIISGSSGTISEVHDPVGILKALERGGAFRIAPEFISAILGIADERVGGDVERYSRNELVTTYARGGFMYQPSEISEIQQIFSAPSFQTGIRFYDLGSGYGHALFYGAALRPDIFFTGIEIMRARVVECRKVVTRLRLPNLAFEAGDVSQGGFSEADVLFLFNPFSPDTHREVGVRIAELAAHKPLAVFDYEGLVTKSLPELRAIAWDPISPFRLAVSQNFPKESCALVGR
jgi:hypothetical protein